MTGLYIQKSTRITACRITVLHSLLYHPLFWNLRDFGVSDPVVEPLGVDYSGASSSTDRAGYSGGGGPAFFDSK